MTPARTPITAMASVLYSVTTSMNSAPVKLTAAVIVIIYIGAYLPMTYASSPLFVPPSLSQVGVRTYTAAALSLPRVLSRLISRPALNNKVDAIHSSFPS